VDYASAISSVVPGTFVPDLGKTNDETPSVSAIPGGDQSGSMSFKDYVVKQLTDVNDKINTADDNTRNFATGADDDIDKVTTSVEEANLALQHMMAIRSKLLDAYSEISRLQV
jgi:flagellar hook-basal body complex protein FliE